MSDLPVAPPEYSAFEAWMIVNGPYVASGCMSIFSLGMLYGGVEHILNALRAKRVAKTMHTFPSVPGEVIESTLITRYSKGGTFYTANIKYAYTVNGKAYKSAHILPGRFPENIYQEPTKAWVAAYPVGRQIEVFYDPKRPKTCLVVREGSHVAVDAGWTMGLGLFLVAMSLGMLYVIVFYLWPEGGKWPNELPAPSAEAALGQ